MAYLALTDWLKLVCEGLGLHAKSSIRSLATLMGMAMPFGLLLALAAALGCAQADNGDGLIHIPLQRMHQEPHTMETAEWFRQQQQTRVRRRIASVSSNDSSDSFTDAKSIGPLVFNEVPLGVGYGYEYPLIVIDCGRVIINLCIHHIARTTQSCIWASQPSAPL